MTLVTRPATLLATVALGGGLAAASLGHAQDSRQSASDARTQDAQAQARPLSFHFADDVLGTTIVSPTGEELSEVDELIAERGTGRILHVIIEHHELMDIGDDRMAIPFGAFTFDTSENRLVLDTTEGRLERMPEFRPERWTRLPEDDWFSALERSDRQARGQQPDDAPDLEDARPASIQGRVAEIDRSGGRDGDTVVISVSNDTVDGRTVILGPSWYVLGQIGCPARGDAVDVTGFRHDDGRFFARTITLEGEQLSLRTSDGTPQWSMRRNGMRSAGDGEQAGWPALFRVSDLEGQDAGIGQEDEGEVQSVVLEMTSGHVAAIGFDPNENILGIADTIRAVPWSALALQPDRIRIDASPAMVEQAMEMPDDLETIATDAQRTRMYTAFDLQPATFERRMRRQRESAVHAATWSATGPIAAAIRDQNPVRIEGRITERRIMHPLEHPEAFTALIIESAGSRSTVLLGPAWYVRQSDLRLTVGQNVEIEARQVRLGDRERLVAVSLSSDAGSMRIWLDGRPAWRQAD